MNLFCFGVSHQTATVEQREQLALGDSVWPQAMEAIKKGLPETEVVLISTCNRIEFYLASSAPEQACRSRIEVVLESLERSLAGWQSYHYLHQGLGCAHHLFEVVAGLQSMVIGETEILGQVKTSYDKAKTMGATGKYLNRLFQNSFSAAKEARTNTAITRGSVSVGSVAVELAERIFGKLSKTRVMVLGAGETSERVARTLAGKGIHSMIVSNRSHERACVLAEQFSGTALRWEDWGTALAETDIIISSTSAPHYVLERSDLEPALPGRGYKPLFLIDLAVPRDIEPSVSQLDSVYLYDIDDLQTIAQANLKERELEMNKCRALLHRHEVRFEEWLRSQESAAAGREGIAGAKTPEAFKEERWA